jgi:hypothetical protein
MSKDYKDVYSLSGPQKNYIEILAIDHGLNRAQMYDSISTILGAPISDINRLTINEASRVIFEFKRRKQLAD